MILSRILSSSSSVASLFPALNLESTYFAVWEAKSQLLRWEVATYQHLLLFRVKEGLNCISQSPPLPPIPTNEFSRFVGPFIDEGLKGLLHGIDESLIPGEAALRHVVHLVLEVQQVLHHVLVFFWGAHYLSSKRLRRESSST